MKLICVSTATQRPVDYVQIMKFHHVPSELFLSCSQGCVTCQFLGCPQKFSETRSWGVSLKYIPGLFPIFPLKTLQNSPYVMQSCQALKIKNSTGIWENITQEKIQISLCWTFLGFSSYSACVMMITHMLLEHVAQIKIPSQPGSGIVRVKMVSPLATQPYHAGHDISPAHNGPLNGVD